MIARPATPPTVPPAMAAVLEDFFEGFGVGDVVLEAVPAPRGVAMTDWEDWRVRVTVELGATGGGAVMGFSVEVTMTKEL